MALAANVKDHVEHIPGVVRAEQGTTTTAVATLDDVTWGK